MATEPDYFQVWNQSIKRGDDWIRTGVARAGVGGDPINLTGATFYGQARRNSSAVAITCTVTDAVAGEFKVQILRAVTETMEVGKWRFDIEVTDAQNIRLTRAGGTFEVMTDYARHA